MRFKQIISLMLVLLFLPVCCAAGESASPASTLFRYTFMPGTALEGEGLSVLYELMNAVTLDVTRQRGYSENRYRVELISEGERAFSLDLAENDQGRYAILCSLLGDHLLTLNKDQLSSFLQTLVLALVDMKILREDAADQLQSLAQRLADMLGRYTSSFLTDGPDVGINLTPYLAILSRLSTAAEETALSPDLEECPGAVLRRVYNLEEEDLNLLVDTALNKLEAIPVLKEELHSGRLHIGNQIITDTFIRELFASMHGNTQMILYENAEQKILKISLDTPDVSDLIQDPDFRTVRGVEVTIQRLTDSDGHPFSMTRLQLKGGMGSLLSVRLDQLPGEQLSSLTGNHVSDVGDMDAAQLRDLIYSMGLTIAVKGLDMILVLPRCVFDLIVSRFKIG